MAILEEGGAGRRRLGCDLRLSRRHILPGYRFGAVISFAVAMRGRHDTAAFVTLVRSPMSRACTRSLIGREFKPFEV